eukprot:scaffold22732_cov17-Tisochrysis_lutea.AAC.1
MKPKFLGKELVSFCVDFFVHMAHCPGLLCTSPYAFAVCVPMSIQPFPCTCCIAALAVLSKLRPDVDEVLEVADEGDRAVQTAQQLVYQVRVCMCAYACLCVCMCACVPVWKDCGRPIRVQRFKLLKPVSLRLPHLQFETVAPVSWLKSCGGGFAWQTMQLEGMLWCVLLAAATPAVWHCRPRILAWSRGGGSAATPAVWHCRPSILAWSCGDGFACPGPGTRHPAPAGHHPGGLVLKNVLKHAAARFQKTSTAAPSVRPVAMALLVLDLAADTLCYCRPSSNCNCQGMMLLTSAVSVVLHSVLSSSMARFDRKMVANRRQP